MITRTETLGSIAARQQFVTGELRDLLGKFGPDTAAISYTRSTPFGDFLVAVEVAA